LTHDVKRGVHSHRENSILAPCLDARTSTCGIDRAAPIGFSSD